MAGGRFPPPRPLLPPLLLLFSAATTDANMYDVIQPHLIPPAGGCQPWAEVPAYNNQWRLGRPPPNAGSFCAQQGNATQAHVPSAFCMSARSGKIEACTSGHGIPEQVNVQIASCDSVVVSFVTFEAAGATHSAPLVELNGGASTIAGVTHTHNPCTVGSSCTGGPYKPRTYFMHFVRLTGLPPRTRISYRVRGGAAGAVWSDTFAFRSPYSDGVTKIALYGDMGVYRYNNMENLHEETVVNETADLILHAG